MTNQNFKIGDIIVGLPSSNSEYVYTTKENEWEGKVIAIDITSHYSIQVETVKAIRGKLYDRFWVNPQHFTLAEKSKSITKNTLIVKLVSSSETGFTSAETEVLEDGEFGLRCSHHSVATSQCAPNDTYNPQVGAILTLARSLGLDPTEQDVLDFIATTSDKKVEPKISAGGIEKFKFFLATQNSFSFTKKGDIYPYICPTDERTISVQNKYVGHINKDERFKDDYLWCFFDSETIALSTEEVKYVLDNPKDDYIYWASAHEWDLEDGIYRIRRWYGQKGKMVSVYKLDNSFCVKFFSNISFKKKYKNGELFFINKGQAQYLAKKLKEEKLID